MVGKGYLKVKGIQRVPKDPEYPRLLKGSMYPKGTTRSKVVKWYLKVHGWQRLPKGPRYPKGTQRSKGIQRVPRGLSYLKGA